MAALITSLDRRGLGVSGEVIEVYRKEAWGEQPCGDDPSQGTSCNSGGPTAADTAIYFLVNTSAAPGSVDHSTYKNVMSHELGHKMLRLAAADAGASSVPKDYTGFSFGNCPGGGGHSRDSSEYQSAALVEGFAHFYADSVYNTVGGAGCGSNAWQPIDWDHPGAQPAVSPYSCDGAPVPGLSTADYYDDECILFGFAWAGYANEYDYQRFFWDLVDKEGLTPADVAEIIGLANTPTVWDTDGIGADGPRDRLEDAADALGYLTEWQAQSSLNGVDR